MADPGPCPDVSEICDTWMTQPVTSIVPFLFGRGEENKTFAESLGSALSWWIGGSKPCCHRGQDEWRL